MLSMVLSTWTILVLIMLQMRITCYWIHFSPWFGFQRVIEDCGIARSLIVNQAMEEPRTCAWEGRNVYSLGATLSFGQEYKGACPVIGSIVVKKPHVSPHHVRELITAIWQFHSLYSSATERWVQASTSLITGNEDQGNEKAIWVEQHVSDLRKRSRSSNMIQASFNMTVRHYCYRWIFLY